MVSSIEQRNERHSEDPKEPEYIKFQIVDVGGQKNERKKWMHCFDDVKCILFLVSLAEYNQVMFEDQKKNRLDDSVKLLKEISNKKEFEKTALYVFMNKKDVFSRMIVEHPLTEKFTDYKGAADDSIASIDYLQAKYRAVLPASKRDVIKFQVITGVVRKDVQNAFQEVTRDLITGNRPDIEAQKEKIRQEELAEARRNSPCVIC